MIENDHTDAELERRAHNYEMGEDSPSEKRWYAFCREVEKLLGCDLDGSEEEDGFSLDTAHDAFEAGDSPTDYLAGRVQFVGYHVGGDEGVPVSAGTDRAEVFGLAVKRILGSGAVGPYDQIGIRRFSGKNLLPASDLEELKSTADRFFAEKGL